jgi:hypothetical protein
MKLRSMTKVAPLNEKKSVVPVSNSEEVNNYIRELQGLFNELSKWKGCPTTRIGIIIDIFTYVDENAHKVIGDPALKILHDSIKNKAKVTMYDIAVSSSSVNSGMLENLKQLASICVSIISKLG